MSPMWILKYSFLGLVISLHWITFFEAIEQSYISVTLAMFSTAAFFTSFIANELDREVVAWAKLPVCANVKAGLTIAEY